VVASLAQLLQCTFAIEMCIYNERELSKAETAWCAFVIIGERGSSVVVCNAAEGRSSGILAVGVAAASA
jgi:hypothetical protein